MSDAEFAGVHRELVDALRRDAEAAGVEWATLLDRALVYGASRSRLNNGSAGLRTVARVRHALGSLTASPSDDDAGCVTLLPVTAQWRAKVRAVMDDQGLALQDVADRIGATPQSVHHILTKARRSTLVTAIDESLGLSGAPKPAVRDLELQVMQGLSDLDADARARVIAWATARWNKP